MDGHSLWKLFLSLASHHVKGWWAQFFKSNFSTTLASWDAVWRILVTFFVFWQVFLNSQKTFNFMEWHLTISYKIFQTLKLLWFLTDQRYSKPQYSNRNKMVNLLQTTYSYIYLNHDFLIWFKSHLNSLPWALLTNNHYWLIQWLSAAMTLANGDKCLWIWYHQATMS